MKSDPIAKATLEGFRNGIRVAAHFADDYNSLSLHPYRLGDCILVEHGLRGGTPRRNAMNPDVFTSCKREVFNAAVKWPHVMQLAQLLDPEAWEKYARNKISVGAEVANRVKASITLSKKLLKAGYRDCTPAQDKPVKLIDYPEPKRRRTSNMAQRKRRKA